MRLDDFRFATYANIAFRHFTALPPAKPPSSFAHAWYKHGVPSAEPGIRRGNEDFCGNENRKSRKIFFSAEKQIDILFFFFKQSVCVAESMEITPWTNVSLPAKSSVNGVIVRGHLHILSYFRDGSIRPVLIGQKSLLNQWTSTLHSKLNGS